MVLRRPSFFLGTLLAIILALTSCGPTGSQTSQVTVVVATSTATPPVITAVVTPEPVVMSEQTEPSLPEPSDTAQPATPVTIDTPTLPAPTHTPTPVLATAAPTPVLPTPTPTSTAPALKPINPANADQVVLLERLGQGALQDMAWLPDGQTLAAIHQTGIYLYDAATLRERQFIPSYGMKASLAASPDGRFLAVNSTDGVQLWDIPTGQMVHALTEQGGGVKLIAFSPDGVMLTAVGSELKDEGWQDWVALWDLPGIDGTGPVSSQLRYRWDDFPYGVTSVAFDPDSRTLVTATSPDYGDPDDTALRFWDVETGQSRPVEGDLRAAPSRLGNLVFSSDGLLLAASDISAVYLWDATTWQTVKVVDSRQGWIESMAFSPDGRFLASGSVDGVAKVWQVEGGQEVSAIAGHADRVVRLAFRPTSAPDTGGFMLATATSRDGVQFWDAVTGQRVGIIPVLGHADYVTAVAYSPDGRVLASAGVDETIWLWNVANGQPLGRLAAPDTEDRPWCACYWSLAFSPDGKTLVAGSTDAAVRAWDVSAGLATGGMEIEAAEFLDMSDAPTGRVGSVTYSSDGQLLAAGDYDGNVWLWDLAAPLSSGPLLQLDNPPTALSTSFSPDGRTLATGSGFGVIRLWDVSSGTLLREMQASSNSVIATFSPDGSILAAGSSGFQPDYALRLWDPATGVNQRTLEGHTTDIKGLAFSPDGTLLAACDGDGFTRLWDISTGQQLQALEQGQWADSVAFHPHGDRLATGGFDGLVRIWGIP